MCAGISSPSPRRGYSAGPSPPRRNSSTAWVLLLHGAAPPWHDGSVGPPPLQCNTSMGAVSHLVLAGLDLGLAIFLLLKFDFWCRLN
jgi:hypothetical protein